MHIAIIGAGNVGTALGNGFAALGHTVTYGLRDPNSEKYAHHASNGITLAGIREAVALADVVVLATPWAAAESALAAAGDLRNKPLVDATNPIGPGMVLTHGHSDSGAEQVARWAKNARVVKAFNITGAENLAMPRAYNTTPCMFVCGDDDDACEIARTLASELGFEALRMGGLSSARLLEPFAMLWIQLAYRHKQGRDFAFSIVRAGAAGE